MTRRDWLRVAVAMSAALGVRPFHALAQSHRRKVKITTVRAMQIRDLFGTCLIKIETDAGLVGYGEAGASGPMARAFIDRYQEVLIGEDPLSIEKHFHNLTSLTHPYRAHIPTISGIDIALWDLAGKITGQPVKVLLGGPFRDAVPLYSHGPSRDALDPAKCREWAARMKESPEGITVFKFGIDSLAGIRSGRPAVTLDNEQVRNVARGFQNLRDAAGDSIDIGVHCHNELDVTSAVRVAKAVEPVDPLFYEDPLQAPYGEGWLALNRSTRVPLLIGEKLELVREFKPFLDSQVADILHPDLAFAGGFTGTKKIADQAMLFRTPVALHNVGSLIQIHASADFGAAIYNFHRSESLLGIRGRRDSPAPPERTRRRMETLASHLENMSAGSLPDVTEGRLRVPDLPGLGFEPNDDYLRSQLAPNEPFWS